MTASNRIVVGVDGSSLSKSALLWAVREARLRGATVDAVCTWDYPSVALAAYGPAAMPVVVDDDLELAAKTVLDKALAELGELEIEVTATVERGPAPRALAAKAAGALFVVVGSRGHGGFAGMLLGSVSRAVVHDVTCPTVIVPGTLPATAAPIVVGVDGSPASAAALRFAIDEARLRGTRVEVVHAWQYPGPVYFSESVAFTPDDLREASQHVLDDMMAALGDHGDVEVSATVERGHPVEVVAKRSEHASLVIVGSRGHGAFTSMVLGSVSNGVIQHAQCPTVVVRPEPASKDGET